MFALSRSPSMPSDIERSNFCGLNFLTKASMYLTRVITDLSLINIVVIFVQRITQGTLL